MIDISPFRACHIIIKKKKHEKLYLHGWDGSHRFEYGARASYPHRVRQIFLYRENQLLLLDVSKFDYPIRAARAGLNEIARLRQFNRFPEGE